MTDRGNASAAAANPLAGLPNLERLSRYDAAQRQEPADRPALEAAAAAAASRLARAEDAGNRAGVLALLGYLGNASRILGRTGEAAALLARAVELARGLSDGQSEVANLIRQGEALRYGGDHAAAERLYRAALARVRAAPDALAAYEDFALQHLGKCRLEQGDVAEAIACFEAALTLRRTKGDPDLIASTEAALRLARETALGR
jgi:tetratricopeptide (TPR) repeat protein